MGYESGKDWHKDMKEKQEASKDLSHSGNRPKITFTTETLHHFSCEVCKKWWSIADWTPTNIMTCPHCSTKLEVALNEAYGAEKLDDEVGYTDWIDFASLPQPPFILPSQADYSTVVMIERRSGEKVKGIFKKYYYHNLSGTLTHWELRNGDTDHLIPVDNILAFRSKVVKSESNKHDSSLFTVRANFLIAKYKDLLESLNPPTSVPLHITCGMNNNIVAISLISTQETIDGIYCGESPKSTVGSRNYILYTSSGFRVINSNDVSCHQYVILKRLTDAERQSQKVAIINFLNEGE